MDRISGMWLEDQGPGAEAIPQELVRRCWNLTAEAVGRDLSGVHKSMILTTKAASPMRFWGSQMQFFRQTL